MKKEKDNETLSFPVVSSDKATSFERGATGQLLSSQPLLSLPTLLLSSHERERRRKHAPYLFCALIFFILFSFRYTERSTHATRIGNVLTT